MRNIKRIWILIMTAAMLCSGCGQQAEEAPELLTPTSVGVSTTTVVRRDFYSAAQIDVSVVPETNELYFKMDGKIQKLHVNKGQVVEEGQVLAVIDQSELLERIQKLQEEINHMESQYHYDLTQADLEIQIANLQYAKLQDQYEKQEKAKREAEAAAKAAAENPLVRQSLSWLTAAGPTDSAPNEESSSGEESASNIPDDSSDSSDTSEESGDPESSSQPEESEESSESSLPEESSEPSDSSESGDNSESSVPKPTDPSQNQMAGAITNYDLSQAQLTVQRAQLSYSQIEDEYNQKLSQKQNQMQTLLDKVGEDTLTAPYTGRVVELYFNEGDRVQEYAPVMILANENVMMLRGEKYSNSSLIRMTQFDVLIDGKAYDVNYIAYDEEEYYQAALNKISLPSRFIFVSDVSSEVQFGESGTVRVYREYSADTLVVPKACVQSDDMGSFVYKEEDGQRVKVYITIGIETETHTEVVDGLNEGDKIYGRE